MNKKISLKELCLEDEWGKYGIPASAEDYDSEKTRYLRITDISEDGELLNNDKKSVSAPDIDKYLLKDGDIVFARTGNSTGKSYYHEDKNGKLAFAGFLIKYSLDKAKVNPKYIKFFTITNEYKNWVKNLSVGSTRGNINAQTFGDCPISVPERKQQDLLVRTLSLIIAKIELNKRINAELEAIAKTLYDYWFVQFDFPNANGKPYKTSGGKMVWNEELKREIPEGWEVKLFGDVVAIKNGRDHKLLNNGTYPVYGSGGVMRQCDTFLYDSESILIPRKGSLGNLFYIHEPFWCVDTIFYTQMKFPQSCKYLFYTTQNFNIAKMNTGTAVPSMTTEILNNLTLVFPSSDILKSFDDLLIPFFKKKRIINIENQKLTELRDWLLPMLMNGQVKVMDKMENELSMAAEQKIEYGK